MLLVFWVGLSSSSPGGELQVPLKKIQRSVSQLWKGSTINLVPVDHQKLIQVCDADAAYYCIKSEDKTLGYVYVGRVNSCRRGGCSIDGNNKSDEFEYFDYYFVADRSGTIKKVKVYNYQATQGHEIMGWGWLRQFIGISGDEKLVVGKDIEAISGATVSAVAITDDIQYQQQYLKERLLLLMH